MIIGDSFCTSLPENAVSGFNLQPKGWNYPLENYCMTPSRRSKMATNEIFSSHFTRETAQPTRSTTSCSECRGDIIAANHETRCRECGLIVDEDHLDYGPEWFDSPENSSQRRTGTPLTAGRHDRGLSTEIGWKRDGQGNTLPGLKRSQLNHLRREHRRSQCRTKRVRNLGYSLGEVRRTVSALELPDTLCEQACLLFRRAQGEDLCQGRSLESSSR